MIVIAVMAVFHSPESQEVIPMSEPAKQQMGDGQDNFGQAAGKAAQAAKQASKEAAKQAAAKGAEATANAAANTKASIPCLSICHRMRLSSWPEMAFT